MSALSLCVFISVFPTVHSLSLSLSVSLCLSVALSFLLSPVSFRGRRSTCYPISWLVQMAEARGRSGFRAAGLHGAASSQGSKCVGRGSSHHSAAQTPSTSNSAG